MVTPAIIRKHELVILLGLSDRTIDHLEQTGNFPKRIQLGARSVGWIYSEVMEWIETRPKKKFHHS